MRSALRRFVVRWEIPFYLASAVIYIAAIVLLILVFPDVSNLWVSIFVLVSGLFATLASMVGAIKSVEGEHDGSA